MPPFCRDCRYLSMSTPGDYAVAKCRHPKAEMAPTEYLVSGKKPAAPEFYYASSMRVGSKCGEEGKLFEARMS